MMAKRKSKTQRTEKTPTAHGCKPRPTCPRTNRATDAHGHTTYTPDPQKHAAPIAAYGIIGNSD